MNLNFTTTSTHTVKDLTQFNCYPNPFTSTVNIDYQLQKQQHLRIRVLTLQGQEIANLWDREQTQSVRGQHTLQWNAENQPNGVYIITFELDGKVLQMSKLVLQKQ